MEWVSEMNLDGMKKVSMAMEDTGEYGDEIIGIRDLPPNEKDSAGVGNSKGSIPTRTLSKKTNSHNKRLPFSENVGVIPQTQAEPFTEVLLHSEPANTTIEMEGQSGSLIGNVTDNVQDLEIDTSTYHLIIEMQEDPKNNPKKHELNTLATMIIFGPSSEKRIDIKYSKQICLIKGDSYVLQEVYGFTELEEEKNS
jgi:hypothetical protein